MTNEAMDSVCAEVASAFRRTSVDCLILKGPAIANWLYTDGTPRPYMDIDVLVDPLSISIAAEVLLELGFSPPAPAYTEDVSPHAHAWFRYSDERWLDLHYTLWGVGVDSERLWATVWPAREPMPVGGAQIDVLGPAARAMHLALHVAQDHLGRGKKMTDLERGIEQVDDGTWEEAARLADELGAAAAMGAGLRQLRQGVGLAERLNLPAVDRAELLVRAEGSPTGAVAFEWFTRRPGIRGKLTYALAKAFPPPWFLRAWTPVASRWGPVGLVLGYLQRLAWIIRTTPRAAASWRRARRSLQPPQPPSEAESG